MSKSEVFMAVWFSQCAKVKLTHTLNLILPIFFLIFLLLKSDVCCWAKVLFECSTMMLRNLIASVAKQFKLEEIHIVYERVSEC